MEKILAAFRNSLKGLKSAFSSERAFRQELALAAFFLPLGLWLGQNGAEKALLAGSVLLILVVELLNTAIEAVTDRISAEIHPLSGKAKDVASAAVLLTLVNAGIIWVCAALPD
jgi:diacylglycerol kinase (ATP)